MHRMTPILPEWYSYIRTRLNLRAIPSILFISVFFVARNVITKIRDKQVPLGKIGGTISLSWCLDQRTMGVDDKDKPLLLHHFTQDMEAVSRSWAWPSRGMLDETNVCCNISIIGAASMIPGHLLSQFVLWVRTIYAFFKGGHCFTSIYGSRRTLNSVFWNWSAYDRMVDLSKWKEELLKQLLFYKSFRALGRAISCVCVDSCFTTARQDIADEDCFGTQYKWNVIIWMI